MPLSRKTLMSREAKLRSAAKGKAIYDNIGGVETVTRMVVAADGTKPESDEAQTGRRLMPLSLPRLKFMERENAE